MLIYVLSQLLSLVGLTPLASLLNLAMMVTFATLAAWAYTRYTGKASELGNSIDQLALHVWDSGLQPAFSRLAEEGSQYAARKAVQRLNSTTTPPGTAVSSTPHSPATKKRV